ncbi:hypothetical protein [Herbiconiux sp. UC225_62]|uniref:hypothetical protein n=1 Tax=Herbiconiux sp. UC225_62 TaxID=3350168 RepID=UPI0036D27B63
MTTVDEFSYDDLERFARDHPKNPPVKAPLHVEARQRPRRQRKSPTPANKGRFYRPDLFSSWDRLTSNLAVRLVASTVLVGGTGLLVVVALTRA